MSSKQVLLQPRISEKSYALAESDNVYVFKVPMDLSKPAIASAVEAQFGVAVTKVNTTVVKGKAKRTLRKGGRRQEHGRQTDFKKAYITLKEGDKIPIFKAEEDETNKKAESK